MKILKIVIAVIFLLNVYTANSLELREGITRSDPEWTELTSTDRQAGYFPKAVVKSDEEGVVYVFDGDVGKTNYVEGKLLAGWPLTRWPKEYQEPELIELYKAHDLGEKGRDLQHLSAYFLGNNLGCYPLTPLRYGDINGNGISEIVLFIGYDFLVFSPDQGKVIFGQRLRQNEWLSKEETDNYFDHYGRRGDHLPQYQSSLASGVAGVGQGQASPGLRGYSKLYFGDFNEDGVHDILVWRKLYISRLVGDETEGFEQLRDTLLHYSLIDGEYQPQETDEATIRGWLAANELTWQKGYPNKSECEGEEGELIPEMHDPLLNDPDVLQ